MEASKQVGDGLSAVIERMKEHKDEDIETAFVVILRKDDIIDTIVDVARPPEQILDLVGQAVENYIRAMKERQSAANDGAQV